MERILLAVDGSEHSMRAADFAGELSGASGAPVEVLYVVPRDELSAPGLHSYVTESTDMENFYETRLTLLQNSGARVTVDAARRVEEAGGTVANEDVIVGRPADEIVSHAKHTHSDCIVMGRRGLGDVRGLFLGSVSHRVGQLSDKTLITTE